MYFIIHPTAFSENGPFPNLSSSCVDTGIQCDSTNKESVVIYWRWCRALDPRLRGDDKGNKKRPIK